MCKAYQEKDVHRSEVSFEMLSHSCTRSIRTDSGCETQDSPSGVAGKTRYIMIHRARLDTQTPPTAVTDMLQKNTQQPHHEGVGCYSLLGGKSEPEHLLNEFLKQQCHKTMVLHPNTSSSDS